MLRRVGFIIRPYPIRRTSEIGTVNESARFLVTLLGFCQYRFVENERLKFNRKSELDFLYVNVNESA